MSLSLVTMETSRPFFAALLRERADHVVRLKSGKFENRQPHGFAHPPHVGQLHGEVVGHRRALRLVLVKQLVAKGRLLGVEHHGEIVRRMFLHQLAQHVGKQVGNFRGDALRAVQPRHGRKEGAEDESHRVDEEEFFRGGGFCHRREYSKAARAAGVCYFIGSRFSRVLTAASPCPNAPKKTRKPWPQHRRSRNACNPFRRARFEEADDCRNFRSRRRARKVHARGLRAPAVAAGDGGTGGSRIPRKAPPDCRGRDRHGQNAGVSDPRDSQRAARGDFDGDEIAAGAAFREGHSVSAEIFRAGA